MTQFAQDHNDTFPGTVGFVDDGSCWHDAVRAGHYSNAIFACPSSIADGSLAHPSYGLNGFLCGTYTSGLTDPARTILSADAKASIILSANDIDFTRHNGDYIASFMDGHVETLSPEQAKIVYSEGEEGNYLVFGVTSIQIGFESDTTAVGTSKQVEESTTVRLINQADEGVTPQVTSTGGDIQPKHGLIPGTSDLHLSTGKSKVFSLYCCMDPISREKVDTTYRFGDEQHMVEITVRRPSTSAVTPSNPPTNLINPPAPPTAPLRPLPAGG